MQPPPRVVFTADNAQGGYNPDAADSLNRIAATNDVVTDRERRTIDELLKQSGESI